MRSSCSLRAITAAASGGVVAVHAEQHQQSRPGDLAHHGAVDPDRGPAHPGGHRPHALPAPAGRAGPARAPRAGWPRPAPRSAGRGPARAARPAHRAAARPGSRPAARPRGRPPRAATAGRPGGPPPRRPRPSPRPPARRRSPAAPTAPPPAGRPSSSASPACARSQSTRSSQPSTSGPERIVQLAGQVLERPRSASPSVRRSVMNPNPTACTRSRCSQSSQAPARSRVAGAAGSSPASRSQVPTCRAGSATSRCSTQASTPGGSQRAHPVRPVLAAHVQPGAEQLGHPARLQVRGQRRQQRGQRGVPALPGVAVDVVHPRRAGHERRVGHDPVEPAPGHRLQPRPVQQLDVELVERERGPGHGQRPRRDVGARSPGPRAGWRAAPAPRTRCPGRAACRPAGARSPRPASATPPRPR